MIRFIFALVCLPFIPINTLAHDLIVTKNSNLRAGPSSSTQTILKLKPGDEAKLLTHTPKNGYLNALHKSGSGWVWSRNVKVIQEYDRGHYKHWIDADKDCQNTRDEVLIAEADPSVPLEFKPRSDGKKCKVISGKWNDPYTGKTFT